MVNLVCRAKAASVAETEEKRSELTEALVRELVSYGKMSGLVGEL